MEVEVGLQIIIYSYVHYINHSIPRMERHPEMHLLTDSYAWPFIRLDPLSSKRHFAFQANNASLLRYLIFSHFLYSLSQLQSSNIASIPIPRLYNRLLEVNSLLASETHDTSTKEVEGQVIYHSWVGTVFGCYHWSHSFLWRLLCIGLLQPWDSQSEIVGLTEFYSTSSNDKSKRRPGGGGDALVLLSLEWTTCTQNITNELNIFLMQHLSSQHRTQSWQGRSVDIWFI